MLTKSRWFFCMFSSKHTSPPADCIFSLQSNYTVPICVNRKRRGVDYDLHSVSGCQSFRDGFPCESCLLSVFFFFYYCVIWCFHIRNWISSCDGWTLAHIFHPNMFCYGSFDLPLKRCSKQTCTCNTTVDWQLKDIYFSFILCSVLYIPCYSLCLILCSNIETLKEQLRVHLKPE